ncbi:MAG: RNA-binding S4 domain-containing protein [Kyrpidia tusciae]|nr:RNA-binding S4 domain-containing protein [Kyrpidia tusciae]MBE3552145.1 RNA-binding S4 domain-containing protein [Kyrpidia tusciae]
MRLDKFLKVSRLVKRRTVAKELCDQGRVQINGRPGKAGSEVNVGDVLTIAYGGRTMKVRVVDLREHVPKDESSALFTVLEDRRAQSGSGPE